MTDFMKADFTKAVTYTLQNEGSDYTDHPNDRGGATKLGITQLMLSHWRHRPVSKGDVQNLTVEEAMNIYEEYFWKPLDLDQINNVELATAIFDTGVNLGPLRAVEFAQRACAAEKVDLTVDGHMGPSTLAALNVVGTSNWFASFIAQIQTHYVEICLADPSQLKFLAGWLKRSQRLMTLI